MIDRKFIKELNDLNLLVNHEENQLDFNSNNEAIIREKYKISYKIKGRFDTERTSFIDLVEVSIYNDAACMEISENIKKLPARLIIDMLKIVDDKVATFNLQWKRRNEKWLIKLVTVGLAINSFII